MPPLHASPDKPNRHISPFCVACTRVRSSSPSVASASIQAGGKITQNAFRPVISHARCMSCSPLFQPSAFFSLGDAMRVLSAFQPFSLSA